MALERTLSIIKPDAVKADYSDSINLMIENCGLKILEQKTLTLSKEQARKFYLVHFDKPFYDELCKFMTSGPIIVQMLEGDNAIEIYRKVMGSTDPKNADDGTIRKKFAKSIQENAVHGSDSKDNAKKELLFFFGS